MHPFAFRLVTIFVLLTSSLPSAHANRSEAYLENRISEKIPPDKVTVDPYQQMLNEDPQHYISLRWMVYMLILFLPIAPPQTPDLPPTPATQTPPPQSVVGEKTDS